MKPLWKVPPQAWTLIAQQVYQEMRPTAANEPREPRFSRQDHVTQRDHSYRVQAT